MTKKTVKEKGFQKFKGRVHIKAWEKWPIGGGENLIKDTTFDNALVTVGKISILKYLGGPTIACCCDSGSTDDIGTGDSSAALSIAHTDLQACPNKAWKVIATCAKVYACCTLFVSVDFGYCCNNWTWNELGLRDTNNNMWARQLDACGLVKNTSKRAIVEWQLSL